MVSNPPHRLLAAARDRVRAAADAIVLLQLRRPGALLVLALLTVLVAGLGAARLELRTELSELLPQGKESVVVAREIDRRIAAASVLTVVAQGQDTTALERFADALAPEIAALGPDLVGSVDTGDKASRAFFEKNALLYAPLEDVQKAHDEIVERYELEVARATGSDLGLDDGDVPPPINAEAIRARLAQRAPARTGHPDGYYLEPDGHLIAVLVHTAVPAGDIDRARVLRSKIEEAIARVDPRRFDAAMEVNLAGDLLESTEENEQIKSDLSHVGTTGIVLVLAVVFCFFLRLRVLAALALTVTVGLSWTFGAAYLAIGHLNSSTGFLVSIVAGNGINFGIIYVARYLEARRAQPLEAAIRTAHAETWHATLAAAGAAMVAYGSLVVTECRAFRHFGVIGGAGMILCWVASYAFLPPMLVLFARLAPETTGRAAGPMERLAARVRGGYGRPFAWAAERFPRAIVFGSMAAAAICCVLAARWIAADPMEYDLGNTRTRAELSRTRQLGDRVAAIVGRGKWDGVALLASSAAEVAELEAALEAKRAAAPEHAKPFDQVITLADFVPKDQDAKNALLREARDRIDRARRRGLIADADWAELEPHLPRADARPIVASDLPAQVRAPFTEKDGSLGRVAYVTPAAGRTLGDARYLMEWADSFRRTTLSDGTVVAGSGRSVIYADLVEIVLQDAPRTILLSLGLTTLIVVLVFRARRAAWVALATLLLGMAGLVAFLALYESSLRRGAAGSLDLTVAGMKLNFLNFVALPISIGVGADYAVNLVLRYRLEGARALRRIFVETGGAVVLCSLTTTVGYLALMLSSNQAIRSFGIAAAAGEVCCVLAAVLVLPAWLFWARSASVRAEPSAGLASTGGRQVVRLAD